MTKRERILRAAYYAVLALPIAFASIGVRARVTRRVFREPFELRAPSPWRTALHTLLAAAIGLLSWFAVVLAVVALLRGAFYPLIAGNDLENSWGGPSLAGTWAVHAALGVGLFPLWSLPLAAFGIVQRGLSQRLLSRTGPWWPLPVSLLLFAGGAAFFIAWLHQA
ncbi:hypothetical protein [Nocardia sp. NBC_01327]|uniref:hypothetical protein n=1 Tax=Nocardia sp. NBC_01327 TaxID=2903593 RepID=UPI002E0D1678|nr:hypothetical protein OG326_24700 [Nocardia sp. NBC_01327]